MAGAFTTKLHSVVSRAASSQLLGRSVFSWACLEEGKAERLEWTEELEIQRTRWNTVFYCSAFSLRIKVTKESVNKLLRNHFGWCGKVLYNKMQVERKADTKPSSSAAGSVKKNIKRKP